MEIEYVLQHLRGNGKSIYESMQRLMAKEHLFVIHRSHPLPYLHMLQLLSVMHSEVLMIFFFIIRLRSFFFSCVHHSFMTHVAQRLAKISCQLFPSSCLVLFKRINHRIQITEISTCNYFPFMLSCLTDFRSRQIALAPFLFWDFSFFLLSLNLFSIIET